jgi:hypothetical protein
VEDYLTVYNTIRPHEAIGFATPISRYLQAPVRPAEGQPSSVRNCLRFLTQDNPKTEPAHVNLSNTIVTARRTVRLLAGCEIGECRRRPRVGTISR